MLSDACFEFAHDLTRIGITQAINDFESMLIHYSQDDFDYPPTIIEILKNSISDVRNKQIDPDTFMRILKLVQRHYDTPMNVYFDDLVSDINAIYKQQQH